MSPDPPTPATFSPARRWGILLNVVISSLLLLAVVVMVNFIASRHFKRFHWMGDSRYQLSPMTLKLLETLNQEVKVIVFFDPDPQNAVYSSVKGLINEYQLVCPKLDVEFVDYIRAPGRALHVKAKYKLNAAADKDLVIFDSNGKVKIVEDKELSDYDWATALSGPEIKRTAFKGEQVFTSAIIIVSDPHQFRAYFLDGHGEHDPASEEDVPGYQKFARLLQEKNIAVERLSLQTNDVPADCQLLLIAGPRTGFTPAELERVESYLSRGGRAFILFRNSLAGARKTGLEKVLAEWGVEVGDNLVIDKSQGKGGDSQVLVVSRYGLHQIVKPLADSQLALILPRSIRKMPVTSSRADGPKVVELATTSESGVTYKNMRDDGGTAEASGVIPVMAAVEKGAIAGVNPDRGSTRIVVVGDSFFLGNVYIEFVANHDFANLAVNWLLDRLQLQQIGPKPIHEYKIFLTQSDLARVRWILLAGLPGAPLLLGLLVWVRRRR